MSDAPKPRAFATAMLFGSAPDLYLATHVCIGPSMEIATAHAVAGYIQQMQAQGVTLPPLTMINAMEIQDGLIRAYMAGGKPGEVTPLRVVPTDPETGMQIVPPPEIPTTGVPYTPPDGSAA